MAVLPVSDSTPDTMAYPDVPNFRRIVGTKLYRSPMLDTLNNEDIQKLMALDIATVVDLRSPDIWEDPGSGAPSLLDSYFEVISVNFSGTGDAFRLNFKVSFLYSYSLIKTEHQNMCTNKTIFV